MFITPGVWNAAFNALTSSMSRSILLSSGEDSTFDPPPKSKLIEFPNAINIGATNDNPISPIIVGNVNNPAVANAANPAAIPNNATPIINMAGSRATMDEIDVATPTNA